MTRFRLHKDGTFDVLDGRRVVLARVRKWFSKGNEIVSRHRIEKTKTRVDPHHRRSRKIEANSFSNEPRISENEFFYSRAELRLRACSVIIRR